MHRTGLHGHWTEYGRRLIGKLHRLKKFLFRSWLYSQTIRLHMTQIRFFNKYLMSSSIDYCSFMLLVLHFWHHPFQHSEKYHGVKSAVVPMQHVYLGVGFPFATIVQLTLQRGVSEINQSNDWFIIIHIKRQVLIFSLTDQ